MDFFRFLPNFPLVNVLASFFDVVFNQNALVTDSKSEKEQIERWHSQIRTNMHAHKQTHRRNARHFRWGKLLAHTLLKCWPDTGVRSVFPHCNSSSYQPLTSDFCPAGMCTSSVSGCTPPYVSIRPCNHLVVESRGGLIYTHFKHFHVKVSTFYLSTMSPLDIRGEVCGFWFLAVLIPGTPTRKGWGWVGAFGVSKTEWSRPHPTPNNSFAPFWQMGNKPLPNARPLLQRQKDHQKTKCVCVSECLWHIVVWFPCFFLLVLKIV